MSQEVIRGTVTGDTEEETQSPSIMQVAEEPVREDSEAEQRQRTENQEQHEKSAVTEDSEEEKQSKMMKTQSEDDKEDVAKDTKKDVKSRDDTTLHKTSDSMEVETQETRERSMDSHSTADVMSVMLSDVTITESSSDAAAEPTKKPKKVLEGPFYVCVSGINPDWSRETFEARLKALAKHGSRIFCVDYGDDNTIAVAGFKDGLDFDALTENVTKEGMKICEVNPPKCVVVSAKTEMPCDKALKLYFKKMGRIKDVKEKDEVTCIIRFSKSEAVSKVCKNCHHIIHSEELFVSRYFDTDFGEVWEQQRHFVALPEDLSLTECDSFKRSLIIEKTKVQTLLNDKLQNYHAKFKIMEELKVECTLEHTTDNIRNLVKDWKTKVLKTWQDFITETIHQTEMVISSDIWLDLLVHVRKEKGHDELYIEYFSEGEDIKLVFVGTKDLFETVTKNIKEEKMKIEAEIQRKKAIRNDKMKTSSSEVRLLLRTDIESVIKDIADDLEMSCDIVSGEIAFKGVPDDITKARRSIHEKTEKFTTFQLQCELENEEDGIHKDVMDMLISHKSDILNQFDNNNLTVEIELEENKIHGCVLLESNKSKAVNILRNAAKRSTRTFELDESKAVLNNRKLSTELSNIRDEFNGEVKLSFDENKSQIVLTSMSDIHEGLMKRVEDFVEANAVYKSSVSVDDKRKIEFIRKHCETELEEMKERFSLQVTVLQNSVELCGNRESIQKGKIKVNKIMEKIVSEQYDISHLGIGSIISQEKMDFFKPVEKDTKSVVTLNDAGTSKEAIDILDSSDSDYVEEAEETNWKSDNAEFMYPCLPTAEPYKCRNGTTITLVKGELEKQEVEVLVCSMSRNLNLKDAKASKDILSCGGTSLQDELKSNYPNGIEPGKVAIIGPGNLSCRKVFLGTLPNWKKDKASTTRARIMRWFSVYLLRHDAMIITKFMKKCLSEATSAGYKSICFASLGTGGLKYPPQEAAELMYNAVISYDKKHPLCIKDVRFVLFPSDNNVVTAFEKEEYCRLYPSAHPSPIQKSNTLLKGPFDTKNGIKITMVRDFIEKQKVDVIVCAVGNMMSFERGASKALKEAAGRDTLMAECKSKYPDGIKMAEVLEINSGNLKCKKIYVTCLPDFKSEEEKAKTSFTEKTMYIVITEMLGRAVSAGFTSISFPVMGTKNLHYPSHFVASLMYNCVVNFSTENPHTCLTDVRFVIFPKDANNAKEFCHEEQLHLTTPKTYSSGTKPLYTKTSNIKVSIETGNLAQFKADVIVCPAPNNLDLSQDKTSHSLLMEDIDLQQKCSKQYPQGIGQGQNIGQIETKTMSCKHVYFISLPTDSSGNKKQEAKWTLTQIFEQASKAGFTSVAVPSLGTGVARYPHNLAADLSYMAVAEFAKTRPRSSVKSVFFVILPNDVKSLEAYKKEEQKQLKSLQNFNLAPSSDATETGGKSGNLRTLRRYMSGARPSKKTKITTICKSSTFHGETAQFVHGTTQPGNSVSLWILSDSHSNIQSAMKRIEKLVQDKYITEQVPDTVIKDLRQLEVDRIEKLQKRIPVEITVDQNESMVVLKGFLEHIDTAKDRVFVICKTATEQRFKEGEAKFVKDKVQWYFEEIDDKGVPEFTKYPPIINMELENTRKGGYKTYRFDDGEKCIVNVENMKEYREKDEHDQSKHVDVIRREIQQLEGGSFPLPKNWEIDENNESVKVVKLQADQSEFKTVEKSFKESVSGGAFQFKETKLRVDKIERIENITLYNQYSVKKADMETYNTTPVEKVLWHCTQESSLFHINYYGFNRSYCEKHASLYQESKPENKWIGAGVCFTNDASNVTHDWMSNENAYRSKIIYQASVLTGKSMKGEKGMRVLLPIPTNPSRMYDSAVNDINEPLEFEIYNDTQAYPKYCIHFSTS